MELLSLVNNSIWNKVLDISNMNKICINTTTMEEQIELMKELEDLGVEVRTHYRSKIESILYQSSICVSVRNDRTFYSYKSYYIDEGYTIYNYNEVKGKLYRS